MQSKMALRHPCFLELGPCLRKGGVWMPLDAVCPLHVIFSSPVVGAGSSAVHVLTALSSGVTKHL